MKPSGIDGLKWPNVTLLQDAIQNFARGLSVIHQEISAPNMQGITNFHAVLHDIDKVHKAVFQLFDFSDFY